MSWETLIVGYVKFAEGLRVEEEAIKNAIVEGLELYPSGYGFLEVKQVGDIYSFKCLNWCSHVDEEKIENLIEKLKDRVESYEIVLYYLDNGVAFFKDRGRGGIHYISP